MPIDRNRVNPQNAKFILAVTIPGATPEAAPSVLNFVRETEAEIMLDAEAQPDNATLLFYLGIPLNHKRTRKIELT